MRPGGLLVGWLVAVGCAAGTLADRHEGPPLQPAAPEQSAEARDAAAPLPSGSYDLGTLPVLSRTLFYVRENYYDKSRLDFRRMALGALESLERAVPEIML